MTANDRLLANARLVGDPIFGCLIWHGSTRNGYGRMSFKGKVHSTHRLAYETWRGPIPEGHHIHHRCGNKLCIQIDHLEVVTPRDHIVVRHPEALIEAHRLAVSEAAKKNRAKTHCVNGHELNEKNTWTRKEGWRQCRVCLRDRQRKRRRRLANA